MRKRRVLRKSVLAVLFLLAVWFGYSKFDQFITPAIENAIAPNRITLEQVKSVGLKTTPQEYGLAGEVTFIRGADGDRQRGIWIPGPDPKSPLIVFLHGLGDRAEVLLPAAAEQARRGYACICPDNRALGESEGTATFGLKEREDLRMWVDWARNEKAAEGSLGFYGGSYGGGLALQSAALHPECKCVVAIHPFTDIRQVLRDQMELMIGIRWIPLFSYLGERKFLRAIGAEESGDVSALDLLEQAESVPPIFLVHGTADKVIQVGHSRRLKEKFPEQIEYVEIERAGHEDLFKKGGRALQERVFQFLDRHLKGI